MSKLFTDYFKTPYEKITQKYGGVFTINTNQQKNVKDNDTHKKDDDDYDSDKKKAKKNKKKENENNKKKAREKTMALKNGLSNLPNKLRKASSMKLKQKNKIEKLAKLRKNENVDQTKNYQKKHKKSLSNHWDFNSLMNSNISIKKYFKMFFSVSVLNFLSLHFRNIPNEVYMSGECYDLKHSELLQLFLILSKSKIIFTYRNNFLLNLVNTDKKKEQQEREQERKLKRKQKRKQKQKQKQKRDNININNNDEEGNGDNYIYEQKIVKRKNTGRSKKKKRKPSRYNKSEPQKYTYKKVVINFENVSEHFLKHIYLDDNECLCILLDDIKEDDVSSILSSSLSLSLSSLSKEEDKEDKENKEKTKHFDYATETKNEVPKKKEKKANSVDVFSEQNLKKESKSSEKYMLTKYRNNKSLTSFDMINCHKISTERYITNNNNTSISKTKILKDEQILSNQENHVENLEEKKLDIEEINKHKHHQKKKILRKIRSEKNKYVEVIQNTKIAKKKEKQKEKEEKKEKENNKEKEKNKGTSVEYIYMSDVGWGCSIRVVQMVLVNILIRFTISKKYGLFHNCKDFLFYKNYITNQQTKREHSDVSTPVSMVTSPSELYQNKFIDAEEKIYDKTSKNADISSIETLMCEGEQIKTNKIETVSSKHVLKNEDDIYTCFQSSELIPEINEGRQKTLKGEETEEDKKSININVQTKNDNKKKYSPNKKDTTEFSHVMNNYEHFLSNCKTNMQNLKKNNSIVYPILRQFKDTEKAKYSIQNIIYETLRKKNINEKYTTKCIQEWLGPTSSAIIMSTIINKKMVCFKKKTKKTEKTKKVRKVKLKKTMEPKKTLERIKTTETKKMEPMKIEPMKIKPMEMMEPMKTKVHTKIQKQEKTINTCSKENLTSSDNYRYSHSKWTVSEKEEINLKENESYMFHYIQKKPLFFSVVFDTGIIYNDRVLKYFNIKQNEVNIIIWICLKLGTDSLNIQKYKKSILSCFHLKQFQAISSGNTYSSAHYFYSANEKGLFYFDPHMKCQEAFTNINENFLEEFCTSKIKFLPWEYLNSSMALAFVVISKNDYFNLIQNLKIIDSSLFESFDTEPKYYYKNLIHYDTENSELIVL